MRPKDKKLYWDVWDNARSIQFYVKDMTQDVFLEDDKTQAAVERRMEIIGEALKRLRDFDESILSERIPEYYKIIGLRNWIAHGYDFIDPAALWDHLQNHLKDLIEQTEPWIE